MSVPLRLVRPTTPLRRSNPSPGLYDTERDRDAMMIDGNGNPLTAMEELRHGVKMAAGQYTNACRRGSRDNQEAAWDAIDTALDALVAAARREGAHWMRDLAVKVAADLHENYVASGDGLRSPELAELIATRLAALPLEEPQT
jgi:hypothetical protein